MCYRKTFFDSLNFIHLLSEILRCTVVHAAVLLHAASFTSIPPAAMFSLNRVEIIGYQTQPVDLRKTPSGTSVADLNIVVPYSFISSAGAPVNGKSFHTVTVWGGMADVAGQYLKPGAQVYVSGRLQTDSWEDSETKEKRSKTKIVAMDLILLDPKDGQHTPPDGAESVLQLLNRAQAIGNVTRDPELRTTTGGQSVVTLGVASNERWKDKATNEMKERTEFHNVVVWGDLAKTVQSAVKKGQRVYVSGRVQTRSFETQAGQKRSSTEIIADQVTLLGCKNAEASASVSLTPRSESVAPSASSQKSSPAGDEAPASVPEIKYESEIKPEDLPF